MPGMLPPVKISFGTIVLNGEPFLRYNLRALYPFAHQIIVAEGASPAAAGIATPDGHSVDGTLDTLREFKANEDPEHKLIIVTAEDEGHPNGFWPGEKHQQSQAYARRATGDWLWQVDVDEFYMPDDMRWIADVLLAMPNVHMISFRQIPFWGGLNYRVDGWYHRYHVPGIRRVFRWGPGYTYVTHRPPSIFNQDGADLQLLGHVQARDLARRGIYLYHYSLLFPHQVEAKSHYYSNVDWDSFDKIDSWLQEQYGELRNPYRVHNVYRYPSWLERYRGSHPPQVMAMWQDVARCRGSHAVQIRQTDDIERLLASRRYAFGRLGLEVLGPIAREAERLSLLVFRLIPKPAKNRVRRILGRVS